MINRYFIKRKNNRMDLTLIWDCYESIRVRYEITKFMVRYYLPIKDVVFNGISGLFKIRKHLISV